MKFAYFGYRDWSYKILDNLKKNFNIDAFTMRDLGCNFYHFINKKVLEDYNFGGYSALLFYGWSWILPEKITDKNICVGLHPSPLPKYRGGSPIQNQIISGEKESAVTLFKIGKGLDDGPIYYQKNFSLNGNLDKIFNRISNIGIELTNKLLNDFENGTVKSYKQNESEATTYKRRNPNQSELKINELEKMTAKEIHNHIRAVQGQGYPNAYIIGSNGKKCYLIKSRLERNNES